MQRIISILVLILAYTVNAETITGKVVGVADGETVLDADMVQHRIRLAGIDASEKKQAFGNRSKKSLSDLMFDKTVNVKTEKRDRYGRQIGKVLAMGRMSIWCRSNAAWRGSIGSISVSSHPMTASCTERLKMQPRLAGEVCGAILLLYRHGISDMESPNHE